MASTDAKPVPQKNVAYRVTFPILDADGDLVTGASGLDSEVSKDGGTFADCTNEATEIATSSGVYYLDLTSTEMNADTVAVIVKTSSSGAKTTTIIMYPEEAGDIRVNVTQFNGTNVTARDIGASVLLSSGTGTGQVTLTSGRVNADITHISAAAVSTSTAQLGVNVVNFGGSAGTFSSGRPEVNTSHWAGTAVGSTTVRANLINIAGSAVSTSTAQLGVNVVNAGGTAWGSGAITAASIASDAITAAKIANGAIDAATFAADVDAEILSYIVDDATRIDASALNTASVTTIPAILTDTAEIGAAGAGLTALASAASLSTVAGYLDTEIAAILADTNELQTDWADGGRLDLILDARASQTSVDTVDTVVDAIKLTTDKIDDTLEDDAGTYRFTTNALEQAPTGGSAPSAADIRAEIDANSTQLAAILEDTGTTLDGKINSVKTKTDSLTFTVAGQVDANIQYVNDVQVNGDGSGTPWGP